MPTAPRSGTAPVVFCVFFLGVGGGGGGGGVVRMCVCIYETVHNRAFRLLSSYSFYATHIGPPSVFCIFIKLHMTAQSGRVTLVSLYATCIGPPVCVWVGVCARVSIKIFITAQSGAVMLVSPTVLAFPPPPMGDQECVSRVCVCVCVFMCACV